MPASSPAGRCSPGLPGQVVLAVLEPGTSLSLYARLRRYLFGRVNQSSPQLNNTKELQVL